ncbi:MAG: FlxA-like family protein [Planctomycetia bacterium]|nr:FlxA-like family protein [Planctomycetia bacterium]
MTTAPDTAPDLLDIPAIDHPVVRGPIPNGFVVRPILDPTQGAFKGVSEVNRQYPLLPRVGSFESGDVDTPLIDRQWSSAMMRIPNMYRRTLVLYELPRTDPSLPRAFAQAVQSVLSIPHYSALAVLDRDADIRKYTGRYVDFHPRVGRMCELDPQVVYDRQVEPLVDIRQAAGDIRLGEISRLPRTMTNYFLGMYRAAVQRMRQRIQNLQDELNGTPPPDAQRQGQIQAEIAALEAEIAVLLPKIEQLEQYQSRLPQIEDDLRSAASMAIP